MAISAYKVWETKVDDKIFHWCTKRQTQSYILLSSNEEAYSKIQPSGMRTVSLLGYMYCY